MQLMDSGGNSDGGAAALHDVQLAHRGVCDMEIYSDFEANA